MLREQDEGGEFSYRQSRCSDAVAADATVPLFQLEDLEPQADQARDRLAAHLAKTDRLASRFEAKRMRAAEAQERAS